MFSPVYVSTEEFKVERFIAGLREDLKGHVGMIHCRSKGGSKRTCGDPGILKLCRSPQSGDPHQHATHRQVTGRISQETLHRSSGKRTNGSHLRISRPFRNRTDKREKALVQNRALCPNCRRPYVGECGVGTDACYKCGQVWHFTVDCPQRNDQRTNQPAAQNQRGWGAHHQQGRVVAHATTTRQVDEPDAVVTSTLPIFGHLALCYLIHVLYILSYMRNS